MEQLDTPIRNDSSLTSDWESGNSTGSLYDVPPSVVILLSFFYGLISLMAFIGNALVIYVVVVAPRMRTVTNYYIANLAIADVTIALFAIPFQFHAALLQRWDLPEFMCQFCPTVQILSVNVSIFTLVAISMDRYRAIMYPLRKKPSKLFSNIVILCIWILSLTFALPLGLFHTFGHVPDPQSPNGEKPFCYIDFGNTTSNATMTTFKYYSFSLVTVEYFVPLAIITFAYSRISYRLWGTKTPGTAQDERDHNILQNKKKVIKMLVVVVSIFAFCWMPWQIYATTMLTIPEVNSYRYINIIFFVCHWLAMSNSCYNPFIYGVYSEKFRREFSLRLPCLRPILGSPEKTGETRGAPTSQAQEFEVNGVRHLAHSHNSGDYPLLGVDVRRPGKSPRGSRPDVRMCHNFD
ncbi:RYamide receptor-like [Tigriopus californicus]|nr:RYamide receptor-like [Tigriopus californicus]